MCASICLVFVVRLDNAASIHGFHLKIVLFENVSIPQNFVTGAVIGDNVLCLDSIDQQRFSVDSRLVVRLFHVDVLLYDSSVGMLASNHM